MRWQGAGQVGCWASMDGRFHSSLALPAAQLRRR